MLSPGRGLRRATVDEMIRRPEALGWKISAVLQSLHQQHEVETWVEAGGARQVRIDDKIRSSGRFGSDCSCALVGSGDGSSCGLKGLKGAAGS